MATGQPDGPPFRNAGPSACPPETPVRLLATACLAARRAGEHVMANLHRRAETLSVDGRDVKHVLDVEAQEAAFAAIRAAWPGHAVLGEESPAAPLPDAPARWVVDPIDGTVNFFRGTPWWCCSVAAQVHGKTVAGAVFAPMLGLLFEASADTPALCGGKPLAVSATDRLDRAVIHTGAGKKGASGPMACVAGKAFRARVTGSAALDICLVANGAADAYFESGIYHWDVAAAGHILERAGGRLEIAREYGAWRIAALASNGLLHEACRETLFPLLDAAP